MARRWNGDVFEEPLLEPLTLLARLDREGDLLTRRTRRRRFFAVPVTRRGDVLVGLIRPGRTFVERSRSSPVFCRFRAEDGMADFRPHLMVWVNSWARLQSQVGQRCRHPTGGDVGILAQP